MKLSAMLDGFWLDRKQEFSKNTIRNYSRVFAYFLAFVGDIEFSDITTRHIRHFLNHLATEREYSKRSVHDAWIPLSSLWTWAYAGYRVKSVDMTAFWRPQLAGEVSKHDHRVAQKALPAIVFGVMSRSRPPVTAQPCARNRLTKPMTPTGIKG